MQDLTNILLSEVKPYDAQVLPIGERPDPRFGRFLPNGTPRLSPSQVNQIHTCPGQWRKVYLEGEATKPSWQADLGSLGHGAIELYLKGENHTNILTSLHEATTTHLANHNNAYWQNPPGNPKNHAANIVDAVQRLMIWIETEELKILSTEQEIFLKYHVQDTDVALMGRYDALFETPTGRQVVADWKFPGRTWPGPSREGYQYATATYLHAIQQGGGSADAYAIIHAGQDGKPIHPDINKNPEKTIKWAQERTRQAIHKVLNQDLPFDTETPGALCSAKWCTFYGNGCPATS